jgi:hypothetical protein
MRTLGRIHLLLNRKSLFTHMRFPWGLPEFGTLKWPKSDRSDLGWEREPTEFVESSLAQTLKCDSLFSDTGH